MKRKQTMQFGPMSVGGMWGRRVEDTVREWSLLVNDDLLLDGFRTKPGIQAWIGEHVGKYTNGAVYINAIVRSEELDAKIKFLMEELISCQEEDGYLGTFLPATRWANLPDEEYARWDPWVSKYCMMGLYAYYQITHSEKAMACVHKLIILLNQVYGEGGDFSLNWSDEHAGLASGSILEPLMLWYELTGWPEAKAFADRIVHYYWTEDAPNTPHLLKNMNKLPDGLRSVGRGKAYEMMSCFVGLVEYARQTDSLEYLEKVMTARDQIARHYRQLTGCMSEREWFGLAENMTEKADLENCVAFTWIQLNARLFEMTGDIRCMDCIEETAFNHILQAISPDGSTWIYYSTLNGPKDITYWSQLPTSSIFKGGEVDIDRVVVKNTYDYNSAPVTCCTTNGQRALGLTPQYACTLSDQGDVYVNLLFDIEKTLTCEGNTIQVTTHTDFPRTADGTLTVKTGQPCKIYLRIPAWANQPTVNGTAVQPGSYAEFTAAAGETQLTFHMGMKLRLLSPGFSNRGKYALAYGPLLLAVDTLPEGWTYDEIVLEIPQDLSQVSIQKENGWPVLTLCARKVFAEIGEINPADLLRKGTETVTLRPYLFCGISEYNRNCAQQYETKGIPYDREGVRTEYRVTVPCVIV